MSESIFDFSSAGDYLRRRLNPVAADGRTLSLTALSRRLGYHSHRGVGMVLDGTRLPSAEMTQRLSSYLRHTPLEHRYFELLVLLQRQRNNGRPTSSTEQAMRLIRPAEPREEVLLCEESFRMVSQWSHLVIAELAAGPEFRESTAWIRAKLRDKVSAAEVIQALRSLEILGILVRNDEGKLHPSAPHNRTHGDAPSDAVKQHHRQMMERATEALEEQAVAFREISSLTLAMDPARIPEAKVFLAQFRDAFRGQFQTDGSGAVFQFNLQFFEHTCREPAVSTDPVRPAVT